MTEPDPLANLTLLARREGAARALEQVAETIEPLAFWQALDPRRFARVLRKEAQGYRRGHKDEFIRRL